MCAAEPGELDLERAARLTAGGVRDRVLSA